jgi:hypothetical protein
MHFMSKGYGQIQRKVLAELAARPDAIELFDLAATVYAVKPNKDGMHLVNDAQLVSVRRALRGLEKAGKAYRIARRRSTYWVNERTGLWVLIRSWQQANLKLAASGDADALKARVVKMLPMIERTHQLGVDINSPKPPTTRP